MKTSGIDDQLSRTGSSRTDFPRREKRITVRGGRVRQTADLMKRIFHIGVVFGLLLFARAIPGEAGEAEKNIPIQRRNLILIQLESFQNFTVGKTLGGRQVTPNLDALTEEGLWFSRCYPQIWRGNTSDAEFLANTSLMPAEDTAVFQQFTKGQYGSLANILKKKGYACAVFHGNTPDVWNRANMYPALGFTRYDSQEHYKKGLTIGLGLSDRAFYAETLKKLDHLREPFFADVLSLSSHHPFKIPQSEDDFDPSPYQDTVFGDYLRALHYADKTLGEFIAGLRKSGLMNRSLVVIYGDHGGVPLKERERLYHFLNEGRGPLPAHEPEEPANAALWREAVQVPLLFIADGASLSGKTDAPVGQIDIAPTIAGLMSFEMPDALGTDLSRGVPEFVIFRGGSIIKDEIWITNITDERAQTFNLREGARIFREDEGRRLFSQPIERARQMLVSPDRIMENHRINGSNGRR